MKNNDNPEWEIVDSLPNEKKTREKKTVKLRLSKKFVIGAIIGLAIAILYPPSIVNLVRTLFAWKWLVLLIALYWLARWLIRRNTRR
jgi:phage shock protein PspC (stress-responsive transcriptional regulator)